MPESTQRMAGYKIPYRKRKQPEKDKNLPRSIVRALEIIDDRISIFETSVPWPALAESWKREREKVLREAMERKGK